MNTLQIIACFSGSSFIFYGLSCLLSKQMAAEFKRFGIPKYLKLTGWLQILGGFTLILGMFTMSIFSIVGAAGLSLLMFLGFAVRIKIKDSFALSAPALTFALLNAFLAYKFYALNYL